ncbi:MAG: DAK2 domain-containing protein, partial [Brevibacterium aurantiacum]
ALGQVSGVQVVRSRNVATLLSALAVYDPFAPSGEIFADMTEAAAGTRVGTIVSAEQLALNPPTGALPVIDDAPGTSSSPDSTPDSGTASDSATVGMRRIPLSHPSQFYRVFIDGKVKTQSTELTTLVEKLADRLLGAGGELLTVVHGPGCAPDVLSHLRDWIRKSHAQVRFQDIDSRDRATLLIMGVE